MTGRVVFSREAEGQLIELYRYASQAASPAIAQRFTGEIVDQCEELWRFPRRGRPRDDLRPGLRTIAFRRRVVIAYAIEPDGVAIVGVFYGGQDFEAMLGSADEP